MRSCEPLARLGSSCRLGLVWMEWWLRSPPGLPSVCPTPATRAESVRRIQDAYFSASLGDSHFHLWQPQLPQAPPGSSSQKDGRVSMGILDAYTVL